MANKKSWQGLRMKTVRVAPPSCKTEGKCCRKTPAARLGIYPACPRAKVRAMHQSAQALALSAGVRIKYALG